MFRPLTLLGHQCAMPREDRLRFDNGGAFFQRLCAELFAHLGQGPTLGVTQLDPSLNLVAYDTMFSHERLDAKEEIFLHRSGDRHQTLFPVPSAAPVRYPSHVL